MSRTPQNDLSNEAHRRCHLLRLHSLEVLSKGLAVGIAIDGAIHGLPNIGQGRLNPSPVRPLHSTAQASHLIHTGMRHR